MPQSFQVEALANQVGEAVENAAVNTALTGRYQAEVPFRNRQFLIVRQTAEDWQSSRGTNRISRCLEMAITAHAIEHYPRQLYPRLHALAAEDKCGSGPAHCRDVQHEHDRACQRPCQGGGAGFLSGTDPVIQ